MKPVCVRVAPRRGDENTHTLHDGPEGKIKGVAYGVARLRNLEQGVFGRYLDASSIVVHIENTRAGKLMDRNQYPDKIAEIRYTAKLLPFSEFDLKKDDALQMRVSNGGGYSDPLERNPKSALEDLINGNISKVMAQRIYEVVLIENSIKTDSVVTQNIRSTIRKHRLEGRA